MASAREELAVCKEKTRALRARISSLPASACEQMLASLSGGWNG
ncbi:MULTISPECIES: hypothetical protein [unclassified Streptomyces]|nr:MULTISPECIES: hypothetical protein [unclassified Streptomyces]